MMKWEGAGGTAVLPGVCGSPAPSPTNPHSPSKPQSGTLETMPSPSFSTESFGHLPQGFPISILSL